MGPFQGVERLKNPPGKGQKYGPISGRVGLL